MAMWGYGIGGFGRSFANTYLAAEESRRRDEENKRLEEMWKQRQEDRAKRESYSAEVTAAMAAEGKPVVKGYTAEGMTGGLDQEGFTPVKGIKTREEVDRNIMQSASRYGQDPLQALQLQSARGGLRKQVREEKQADFQAAALRLGRQAALIGSANGPSMESWLDEATKLATDIPDGRTFGYEIDQQTGQPVITMIKDGKVMRKPADVKSIVDQLIMYSDPKSYQAGRANELKADELGIKREELGIKRKHEDTLEKYYGKLGGYYESRSKYWETAGGAKDTPEQKKARIYLSGLNRQEEALIKSMDKIDSTDPDAQKKIARIHNQINRIRKQQFTLLTDAKILPPDSSFISFAGLNDPIKEAREIMAAATNEQEAMNLIEGFDDLYGDAPEAAQARQALQVWFEQTFWQNKPQPLPWAGGLKVPPMYQPPMNQGLQGTGAPPRFRGAGGM